MDESNSKKYGNTRANMSRDMNEGVTMNCKAIAANLLTILRVIVGPTTPLENQRILLRYLFPLYNLT